MTRDCGFLDVSHTSVLLLELFDFSSSSPFAHFTFSSFSEEPVAHQHERLSSRVTYFFTLFGKEVQH